MCLSLLLFWCSGVVRDILGYNSRFGVFNSRLGQTNSLFGLLREFARKGLIWAIAFAAIARLRGKIQKIPGFDGKYWEFALVGGQRLRRRGAAPRGDRRLSRATDGPSAISRSDSQHATRMAYTRKIAAGQPVSGAFDLCLTTLPH